MDITNTTTSSSSSWDIDMTMENHPLLNHTPTSYDFLDPNLDDPLILTQTPSSTFEQQDREDDEEEVLGAVKEMMYKIAAMQPVDIDPSTIKKPKRRNVRISDDPQSVAARHRRERISEKIRILQRLVPGGTRMDTVSMLEEAIHYVKFLKRHVMELQANGKSAQPAAAVEWGSHGLGSSSGAHYELGFDCGERMKDT